MEKYLPQILWATAIVFAFIAFIRLVDRVSDLEERISNVRQEMWYVVENKCWRHTSKPPAIDGFSSIGVDELEKEE